MKNKQDLLPPLKEWCEALRDVHTFAPEAIIAGGALRDLNTGVKVKDIDIFLQYTDKLYEELCNMFGEENISALNEFSEEQYETLNCMMGGVWEIKTKYTSTPVQIISIMDFGGPKKQMKRFDIGLCKLCHDGVQYKTDPEEFFTDLEEKTFTIYCQDMDVKWVNRSLKHAHRLGKKYPDYVAYLVTGVLL